MAGDVCLTTDVFEPQGAMALRAVGSLLIGTTSLNEQRRERRRRVPGQGSLDYYLVQVFTAGAGDIRIFDLSRPLESRLDAGSTLSVMLPQPLLEEAAGPRNLDGLVLKAGSPMTSLLVAWLEALCALEAPLPKMQALAAQEAVVTLLSVTLRVPSPGDAAQATPVGAGLRQRVMDFISRNLCLLELSPEFLCRRFNVSRAHLYRAFAASGGVAKVLRDMRLDVAYQELTHVSGNARSITEMASSLGFSSGNQLLRGFRSRFGMTPSEARAAGSVSAESQ